MSLELRHPDRFVSRHIGPSEADIHQMLKIVKAESLDDLMDQTVPGSIRLRHSLDLPTPVSEQDLLEELEHIASKNQIFRSYIGMGYSDSYTPLVILRNILQNPGWYTQYTPYQAEISQGRLEALLNYQTMVMDLTGLDVANASLLDEGTAAAEAMHLMYEMKGDDSRNTLFISSDCHPQTIEVVRTRAWAVGIEIVVGDYRTFDSRQRIFGAIVQYPTSDGAVVDYRAFIAAVHTGGGLVTMVTDLLALCLLTPPGELGADVAVGNSQRFGVPLGYGGPHAAFFATRNDFVRKMPGRIIGVSKDAGGKNALRMALQTREQHIRREKATSNVCTAQALLAIVASMYAVYHGPAGLRAIAERTHGFTVALHLGLSRLGVRVTHGAYFDTLRVEGSPVEVQRWIEHSAGLRMNFRVISEKALGISLDETTSLREVIKILELFGEGILPFSGDELIGAVQTHLPEGMRRKSAFLKHSVFNSFHSETEMLRYIKMLESRDLSLTHSMIPLGSCTMKLNATMEMIPVTWPQFNRLHPFAPKEQARGYEQIFSELESYLSEITGFPGISLQPNAGSQGEFAGLLVIRKYLESIGDGHRKVCLIPSSAHGTNPASAVMAGMNVIVVACDEHGNVDLKDLEQKAKACASNLAALMITYPSTHGVFEHEIRHISAIVHTHGGQVYMDGANMNAQVGLCRPADFGADVCHLNLHKTFCIPHGGGGPGMGPIGVAEHLIPFLPGHPVIQTGGHEAVGPISAAPWGSASILLISWAYIRAMGEAGLRRATEIAILNANYIAERLEPYFRVFYRGTQRRVAHECILDMRSLKKSAGIEVDDVAKRLMDFGFHAPTMSFPIPATMMVEPTESESKVELDRFCDALIAIYHEIAEIERGTMSREDNLLKNAPHTAEEITKDDWKHPYSRSRAAFPSEFARQYKFWPYVGRINNALGDRNLMCSCPPTESYRTDPGTSAS